MNAKQIEMSETLIFSLEGKPLSANDAKSIDLGKINVGCIASTGVTEGRWRTILRLSGLSFALSASLALGGCGGGGDSPSNRTVGQGPSSATPPTAPPAAQSASLPTELVGGWAVKGGGEIFEFEGPGTYRWTQDFADQHHSETGNVTVTESSLTTHPTSRQYRVLNSGWQTHPASVRTFSWKLLCDSVVDKRVLRLSADATITELHADGSGGRCTGTEEDLRAANYCVTPSGGCSISVGSFKVGDVCTCDHPVTKIYLDTGRAEKR